jgi:glyoxylase-like metal-dependent hydrolase (beta-lactamase superfamily II)
MSVVEEVADGLYKIPLALPIPSLQNVFVYLFRDGEENILVDTGWNSEEAYAQLNKAFETLDFKTASLKTIIISHMHPDHFGLSSILKKESPGAKMLLHQRDAQDAIYSPEAFEILRERMRAFLAANGVPKRELEEMMSSSRGYEKRFSGLSRPDLLLKGGEILRAGKWELEVIPTPGHTRGCICLFDGGSNILFSGDHVLPRITPNVSLSPLYEGDPLGDYLRSLRNLKKMDPEKILPSHEHIFNHLGHRIEEIEKHHDERLAEISEVLERRSSGSTGFDVAKELSWSSGKYSGLTPWQKSAAIGETLAHLEYLKRNNRLFELREGTTQNEIITYSPLVS